MSCPNNNLLIERFLWKIQLTYYCTIVGSIPDSVCDDSGNLCYATTFHSYNTLLHQPLSLALLPRILYWSGSPTFNRIEQILYHHLFNKNLQYSIIRHKIVWFSFYFLNILPYETFFPFSHIF